MPAVSPTVMIPVVVSSGQGKSKSNCNTVCVCVHPASKLLSEQYSPWYMPEESPAVVTVLPVVCCGGVGGKYAIPLWKVYGTPFW